MKRKNKIESTVNNLDKKWNVILGILQLAYHNPEIDQKTGEVKMTKCPKECGRQWRLKQRKLGWQKQREEEKKEEKSRKQEKRKERKEKKPKKMEVRKIAEEQEIWNEEEEAVKSEEEIKKLVLERFHKWIKVFGEKQSEKIPTIKVWDHAIDMKKGFVPRKRKVYLLSREEKEKVCNFINEQLRKEYIRSLKLPQTTPVFFIGKKNEKKRMVQDYRYLNEWIVKNNYPLPLILNVIENISTKKMFTKIDLR